MSVILAGIAGLITYWVGQYRGVRQGRADAFAEVQRWHLEDEEALKRTSGRG